jgi:hypothetical protein
MNTSIQNVMNFAEEHDCSKATMLAYACDYIDGIVGGNEGFERYLAYIAAEEKEDDL